MRGEGSMRQVRVVMFLSVAAMALSCNKRPASQATPSAEPVAPTLAGAAAPTAPTAPAAPATESATPTLDKRMAEHFTKAAAMKTAVIHGDVATLKKEADWMAKHELSGVPESWRPHMQAMHTAAQHAVDAKNLESAAQAVAEMGGACGACHKALGGPKLEVGTPPAEGSGAALHMVRHQWAADRMWQGLIGPSDVVWAKGADVLADAPLTARALSGDKSVPPEIRAAGAEGPQLRQQGPGRAGRRARLALR